MCNKKIMNKRKKVAVIFIYLQNNLGDDLFLEHLCRRYPAVDFYVMKSNIRNRMLESIENLYFSEEMRAFFPEFAMPELSRAAKKYYGGFDACVVLGGSIFMQFDQSWQSRLRSFKNRTSLNESTYVLGANFGPFTSAEFLTAHRAVFSKIKDLCFRDSFSAAFFPDAPNIRFAPDILFSYNFPEEVYKKKAPAKERIAISVINVAWDGRPLAQLRALKKNMAAYSDKIVALCSEIASRGLGISLLSFSDRQGDLKIAQSIEARCLLNGVTDVDVYSYDGDTDAVLSELASSKAVVATRFHAMVLGFRLGKPVYPIIYDEKQKNVLQDLNFFGKHCRVEDIDELDPREVVDCLINEETANAFDARYIENVSRRAEAQFAGLDRLLERE